MTPSACGGTGWVRSVVVLALGALACGCGQRYPLVPVSGKVTFGGGRPPVGGTLYFLPLDGKPPLRPAIGSFNADGSLRVTSFNDGDGLLPGRYKVELQCVSSRGSDIDTMTSIDNVPPGFTPPELVVPASGGVEYVLDVPKKSANR